MSIAYVPSQSCIGQAGSSTQATSLTFTSGASAITAGSCLCVFAAGSNSVAGSSFNWTVTDNASNTYTAISLNNADGESGVWGAFVCKSTSGNPTQFTITDSAGGVAWFSLIIDVFTGVDSSGSFTKVENNQNAPGTSADAVTTGTLTPSIAGVIWGAMASFMSGTATGTGETGAQSASSTQPWLVSEYKTCSTSAIASTWTNSTNGSNASYWADSISIALSPAAVTPFGQFDWPNPLRRFGRQDHSMAARVQLIGQDRLYGGPGQVPVYDLSNPTPRKADNAVNRTWLQTLYTFFLPNPFGPFDWPNPVRRLFRLQDHSEETQAQLIGQDRIYAGPGQVPVYDTSNPQARKADNAVNRSWLVNLLQATLGIITAPFGPFDWPNPVRRLFRLQDHSEATQAQLIGKDIFYGGAGQVPTHEHSVANPVLRKPNFELRTWLLDIIQILTTIFPKPPLSYDWPNPGKFVDQLKAWARIAGDAQQLGPVRPLPNLAQPPAIPPVPHSTKEPAFDSWITQIARNANLVLSGKINATARVVLNPGQDNTVLNDSRIGALSHITLTPLSASAADVLSSGLIWFEPSKGSVIIHHPVMGYFDASCSVLIVG